MKPFHSFMSIFSSFQNPFILSSCQSVKCSSVSSFILTLLIGNQTKLLLAAMYAAWQRSLADTKGEAENASNADKEDAARRKNGDSYSRKKKRDLHETQ